jgi:hypothetical protein
MKNHSVSILLILNVLFFSGCVTYIPAEEYNLARAAYEAAREANSAHIVPALWFKAEQAYRAGQASYKERRYDQARVMLNQARILAEQAETAARVERQKSGEFVP